MTIIVCERSECMYNKADRCQCNAIGIKIDGCDSHMEIPDVLKKYENEHAVQADAEPCAECDVYTRKYNYKHCPWCGRKLRTA